MRRYVEEAVASYAMSQWLMKKGDDGRGARYRAVWEDMLGKCVSVVFRLRAPIKGKED